MTKVKTEKGTKDRTVRDNRSGARCEGEVLAKLGTPEVQKHLRPRHIGSEGECKEEGLKYVRKLRKYEDQEQMAGWGSQKLIVTFRGPGGKQKPAFKDMRTE